MADNATVVFGHVLNGINSALDPALLPSTQLAKAINVQIDHQLVTTRPGARFIPVEGPDTWREGNFQGARFYNPARGQGAQVFADESASIISAHAGRHYRFFPGDKTASVEDITGEDEEGTPLTQTESALILWHEQAENYLIAGDDESLTWIYDGVGSRFSEGFIGVGTEEERDQSQIPHGIRAIIYAHGRIWVVQNANRILSSDSLHGANQTNPEDLLKFNEQVYWASGQYFVPPSSMGNIIAAAVLPTRDTNTGQGELMFHCVNGGVFSINGNVFPREAWSDTPMVNHFLLDTAASGPYAIDLQEGDQLFRSRVGIQTLRSARAESRLIGRPLKPISEEVGVWLDSDYVPYLRFASLVNHPQQERMLCTTGPILDGKHRYHKGLVVMNWDALDSGQAKPAWEGLWTFPNGYRYIAQMVRGMFADNERVFGFHYNGSKYSLVEYDERLKEDILEDGTAKPIQSRAITREISGPDPYVPISLTNGGIYLRDICRTTNWSVWARTEDDTCWHLWREGSVCVPECPEGLLAQQPLNHTVELGGLPGALEQLRARRWQFLVQWEGWARIEALRVRLGQSRDEDAFSEFALCLDCEENPVCCELGDFDYSAADPEDGQPDDDALVFTSAHDRPDTPLDLEAVANGTDQIDLTWTDTAAGETEWELRRSLDGVSGWETVANPVADATSHSDTDLDPDTEYFYQIRPIAELAGDWSNIASATTEAEAALWVSRTSAADLVFSSVAYGSGLFVAIATDPAASDDDQVMTSPDGATWTRGTEAGVNHQWHKVRFLNGIFVVVGYGTTAGTGSVMTSPDGLNWTIQTASPRWINWFDVAYGNGVYVAVSQSAQAFVVPRFIMTSPDAVTWTTADPANTTHGRGIAFGNGLFVALQQTNGNRVSTSPDGVTWTQRATPQDSVFHDIIWVEDLSLFVAVGGDAAESVIMTSPDGVSWTLRTSPSLATWASLAYGNGLIVAVSFTDEEAPGFLAVSSPDGINWTEEATPVDNDWQGVAFGVNRFAAVSSDGTGDRVMTRDAPAP